MHVFVPVFGPVASHLPLASFRTVYTLTKSSCSGVFYPVGGRPTVFSSFDRMPSRLGNLFLQCSHELPIPQYEIPFSGISGFSLLFPGSRGLVALKAGVIVCVRLPFACSSDSAYKTRWQLSLPSGIYGNHVLPLLIGGCGCLGVLFSMKQSI